MAKKHKRTDELTPSQQLKRYKGLKWTFFFSEFLSIFLPFAVIGIANFNEYFVEYNGTKMSIACIMAFAIMGLAVWLVSKNKFSNSFITLIIGWVVVDFIFFLMGSIINDIAYIMLFGLIGILGAYGLDLASKKMEKKADSIKKGMEQANTENIASAYKQEIETKRIKVKINKKK